MSALLSPVAFLAWTRSSTRTAALVPLNLLEPAFCTCKHQKQHSRLIARRSHRKSRKVAVRSHSSPLPSIYHSIARHHYRPDNISTPLSCPVPLPPGPYIVPLSKEEMAALLPISGTGDQVIHCLGGPEEWARRLAVSLLGTVLFCNVNVVATAAASLYWVWSPLANAARNNVQLRWQYKYAGIWCARLLEVKEVRTRSQTDPEESTPWKKPSLPRRKRFLRLLIGDTFANIQLYLPLSEYMTDLRPGEPAELLVLSDKRGMPRFRAVRDVFLPERRIWVAEYPAVERPIFEDISATLEQTDQSQSEDEDCERRYSGWFNEEDVHSRQYDHPGEIYGSSSSSRRGRAWSDFGDELGSEAGGEWSGSGPLQGDFDFYQDDSFRES